ncbi:hypothetical protein AMQ28_06155 [Acinetobacter sp. TTH0-4]|nr:hypothetical protein AMQ28_06155 [Acinetobacter sp. TTH0-4]
MELTQNTVQAHVLISQSNIYSIGKDMVTNTARIEIQIKNGVVALYSIAVLSSVPNLCYPKGLSLHSAEELA